MTPPSDRPSPRDERFLAVLELIWADDTIDLFLNGNADEMRALDYSPTETLDALRHNLTASAAAAYYGHGLTAHQAHLIEHNPRALNNLLDRPTTQVPDLLDTDLPRDHLVNVLQVAASATEVDRLATEWQTATPAQRRHLADREAMQAAFLDHPAPIPGCCPTRRNT